MLILIKKITIFIKIRIYEKFNALIILNKFKIIFEISLYIILLNVFLITINTKLIKNAYKRKRIFRLNK